MRFADANFSRGGAKSGQRQPPDMLPAGTAKVVVATAGGLVAKATGLIQRPAGH